LVALNRIGSATKINADSSFQRVISPVSSKELS
jgi:hypothetical protein